MVYNITDVSNGYVGDYVDNGGTLDSGSSSRPALEAHSSGVRMELLALNKLICIDVSGQLTTPYTSTGFQQWDAIATCDVKKSLFDKIFVFQSDGVDVTDASDGDFRFYVDPSYIPVDISLNIATVTGGAVAMVDAFGAILTNQSLSKDYVRHLAYLLFNTAYGADLFTNEDELVTSVGSALTTIWQACAADLQKISTTSTSPPSGTTLYGTANHKYLKSDSSTSANICREMFRMLLSGAPTRFVPLTDLAVNDSQKQYIDPSGNNLYYLPLEVGDQIVIRVVLKPSSEQVAFSGDANDTAAIVGNERAYLIKLNIVTG